MSVEQYPSNGTRTHFRRRGRSFPKRMSPDRNLLLVLTESSAALIPSAEAPLDGRCSRPRYGLVESFWPVVLSVTSETILSSGSFGSSRIAKLSKEALELLGSRFAALLDILGRDRVLRVQVLECREAR